MVGGEARGARGGPAGHTGPPGKELDSSAEMGSPGRNVSSALEESDLAFTSFLLSDAWGTDQGWGETNKVRGRRTSEKATVGRWRRWDQGVAESKAQDLLLGWVESRRSKWNWMTPRAVVISG